jgi:hypothetical protein
MQAARPGTSPAPTRWPVECLKTARAPRSPPKPPKIRPPDAYIRAHLPHLPGGLPSPRRTASALAGSLPAGQASVDHPPALASGGVQDRHTIRFELGCPVVEPPERRLAPRPLDRLGEDVAAAGDGRRALGQPVGERRVIEDPVLDGRGDRLADPTRDPRGRGAEQGASRIRRDQAGAAQPRSPAPGCARRGGRLLLASLISTTAGTPLSAFTPIRSAHSDRGGPPGPAKPAVAIRPAATTAPRSGRAARHAGRNPTAGNRRQSWCPRPDPGHRCPLHVAPREPHAPTNRFCGAPPAAGIVRRDPRRLRPGCCTRYQWPAAAARIRWTSPCAMRMRRSPLAPDVARSTSAPISVTSSRSRTVAPFGGGADEAAEEVGVGVGQPARHEDEELAFVGGAWLPDDRDQLAVAGAGAQLVG